MNHRTELEYGKLLRLAVTGKTAQINQQRRRLATLDRNEELEASAWSKIDLLVKLRERDSNGVFQIVQTLESMEGFTYQDLKPLLGSSPEAITHEFLTWCEAILLAAERKSFAQSRSLPNFKPVALVAVPLLALMVVFGGFFGEKPTLHSSQQLSDRFGPAIMLFCQGIEFTRPEDGTRGFAPWSRGTAWAITESRVVTNRHVIETSIDLDSEVRELRQLGMKPVVKNYLFPVVSGRIPDVPFARMPCSRGSIVAVPVTKVRLSGDHDLASCEGLDWVFDTTCTTSFDISLGQKITAVGFPASADEILQWSVEEGIAPEQFDNFSFSGDEANVVTIVADVWGSECFFPSVLDGQISKIHESLPTFSHTAPTSGGASGSPIFDEYGEVVGVITAGSTIDESNNIALQSVAVEELFH